MNSGEQSQFYCDCAERCKSVRRLLPRSTWYTHAPYRVPLRPFAEHAAGFGVSVGGDRGNTDTRPWKKRRIASPAKSDSVPNSQSSQRSEGFARMESSDDAPPLAVGDSDGFGQSLPEEDDIPDPGSLMDPLDENEDIQDPPEPTPPASPILPPQQPDADPPPRQNIPPVPTRAIYEPLSAIEDIQTAQLFIQALEGASLDESGLDAEVIHRLQNPIQECVDISDNKDFRLSLDIYLADTYASEATYEATRQGILRRSPDIEMLSHHRIKTAIEEMTGVVPISHDMCPNSCVAY
ncbi:hypothetical protein B0H12DRAFT_1177387, partial [Mycena haematopus]